MWRSLVARLNGVQEAAGSIPVTRTKGIIAKAMVPFYLFDFEPAASYVIPERLPTCRRASGDISHGLPKAKTAGSIPVTRTKKTENRFYGCLSFLFA